MFVVLDVDSILGLIEPLLHFFVDLLLHLKLLLQIYSLSFDLLNFREFDNKCLLDEELSITSSADLTFSTLGCLNSFI